MKLFESTSIGGLEIRNRIVMPAMHLGFCRDEYIDERIISFYRERGRGGAGLIVVGGCNIDQHGYRNMVSLRDDKFIPGHRRLANAIKETGARACAQLFQPGAYSSFSPVGMQPIAPSAVPSGLTREMPREMTLEDIREVIGRFAAAARRAVEAGYDMVEVIASAGYLISEFFSPVTNRRTDEYGGSFANRCRFGEEVVQAVRRAVGDRFPVMVRLTGHEFIPGGNTNLEVRQFARRLQDAGADAFNVTGGWHESRVPQITMNVPNGAYVYLAQGIKQAVDVPVVACNRINDPWLAEEILMQGRADLIGMARGLMADPDLPRKAMEGRFNEIRKCVACNQGCLDAIFSGESCRCLVNARVGREAETEIKLAATPRKVLVIGGGPAGLEAARVAALRGHEVSLWEKEEVLGGQLQLAAAVPGRADFYHLIDYLEESLFALGVEVVVDKEATPEEIEAFRPDAIVVATGARPVIPAIPGVDLDHVVGAWEVIGGEAELGQKVVVIGGGATGCEVAMYIASMGTIDSDTLRFLLLNGAEPVERIKELALRGIKEVVVIEQARTAGRGIGASTRWSILQDLRRMGVDIRTSTRVLAIAEDGVVVAEPDGQTEKIAADSVVIAAGSRAENSLFENLKQKFPEVYLVGDACNPRTVLDAIREGFDVGNSI